MMESSYGVFTGEDDLNYGSLSMVSVKSNGMMLVVKNCLTCFLWEELDSPPLAKSLAMVLTMISELCFCILQGKMVKTNGY